MLTKADVTSMWQTRIRKLHRAAAREDNDLYIVSLLDLYFNGVLLRYDEDGSCHHRVIVIGNARRGIHTTGCKLQDIISLQ